MAYAETGRLEQAETEFRRAAKIAPRDVGPLLNLGRLYEAQEEYQIAARAFEAAMQVDPKHSEAAFLAGEAWRQFGSALAAKRCYRKALDIRPDYAEAHARLGEVLTNGKRVEEARGHLERARALGDNSPRTLGYLGLAGALGAQTLEEGQRALEHLRAARAAGEQDSHLFYGIGLAGIAARQYDTAEQALLEGIRLFPDVAGFYYTLADVYAATGRGPESRAAREKSARLAQVRDREEAFLQTIAGNPNDPRRYLRYVDWLLARGDYQRAIEPIRQALRLEPRNRAAIRSLQQAAHALRRPDLLKALARGDEETEK